MSRRAGTFRLTPMLAVASWPHRVYAGVAEIGGGSKKTSRAAQAFVSGKLLDPRLQSASQFVSHGCARHIHSAVVPPKANLA